MFYKVMHKSRFECIVIINTIYKSQTWGCTFRLTARVILGQTLSIATCGCQVHIEVTACDKIPNLLTTLYKKVT